MGYSYLLLASATLFTMISCGGTPPATPTDTEQSPRTFSLSSNDVNVRDFGARGDGVTNDIDAFDQALDALGRDGGTLFVPAGTYILQPKRMGAIEIFHGSNITIAGEGFHQSIIRMAPVSYDGGATHIMLIQYSSQISVRDITLDGNYPNASYSDRQSHGVEARNSSDLTFSRVRFTRTRGDGMRLVGLYRLEDFTWVERVVVENCRFKDTHRSGVGMQRAVRDVQIRNNRFEGVNDQSISSEGGGKRQGDVAPRDILVEGNVIVHDTRAWAVAMEGITVSDPLERIVFRNNRVENGSVSIRKVDGLLIEANTIIGGWSHPALELPANVTHAQVVDNDISGAWSGTEGIVQVAARVYRDGTAYPAYITLRNNRIRPLPGVSGIMVRDALSDVAVLNNQILGRDGQSGIHFLTLDTTSLRPRFTVRGNVIQNFVNGVTFSARGDLFTDVVIRDNAFDHDQTPPARTVGILFNKTGPYQAFATIAGNIFGSGILTPISVVSSQ